MIGSFKRRKGHDWFLQMADQIRSSFPNVFFAIVGEPLQDDFVASSRYQAEVMKLAAELNLLDRCLFLGNQKDVRAFYNACDLTALLSRHEGTPNVALESMACGIPVIASDVSDNRTIILDGKTGYLVARGDVSAAATRAVEMLRNQEERLRLGETARRHVCATFSLRSAAAKLEKIYCRSLRGHLGDSDDRGSRPYFRPRRYGI